MYYINCNFQGGINVEQTTISINYKNNVLIVTEKSLNKISTNVHLNNNRKGNIAN